MISTGCSFLSAGTADTKFVRRLVGGFAVMFGGLLIANALLWGK